jgi:dihydroxyacetone kinase
VVSDTLTAAILAAADAVDAARPELGRLDGAAGDGDHGMTMSMGARNVRRRFAGMPAGASTADVVRAVALAMSDVGGAIGPIYATALTAIAAEIGTSGAGSPANPITRLRRAAEAAERAVIEIGHARPGDKTIIDALHPAVEALRVADTGTADVGSAIRAAVQAAEAGAASTADMVARVGRASRLGERSRGLPDAGATSFAIIVRAMVGSGRGASTGGG